jgi:hypothetical protein
MIRRVSSNGRSDKDMHVFKEELLLIVSQVGIVGTLELISEICRDFSDNRDFDPFWKMVETHCHQAAELFEQQVQKRN